MATTTVYHITLAELEASIEHPEVLDALMTPENAMEIEDPLADMTEEDHKRMTLECDLLDDIADAEDAGHHAVAEMLQARYDLEFGSDPE